MGTNSSEQMAAHLMSSLTAMAIKDNHGKIFNRAVIHMNNMYDLPVNTIPQYPAGGNKQDVHTRLTQFKDILTKECAEIDDILLLNEDVETREIHILTALADLLGDLVIYIKSESLRWGIPLDEVLLIIMESNFTKLGADGKPIKDENDKFLKGPGFVPPEAKIGKLLLSKMQE